MLFIIIKITTSTIIIIVAMIIIIFSDFFRSTLYRLTRLSSETYSFIFCLNRFMLEQNLAKTMLEFQELMTVFQVLQY